jgi:hypothetical protein
VSQGKSGSITPKNVAARYVFREELIRESETAGPGFSGQTESGYIRRRAESLDVFFLPCKKRRPYKKTYDISRKDWKYDR